MPGELMKQILFRELVVLIPLVILAPFTSAAITTPLPKRRDRKAKG